MLAGKWILPAFHVIFGNGSIARKPSCVGLNAINAYMRQIGYRREVVRHMRVDDGKIIERKHRPARIIALQVPEHLDKPGVVAEKEKQTLQTLYDSLAQEYFAI